MAAIRAKNSKPELVVRRGLHARGLRFRLHKRSLPGTPDLVFPSHGAVLFVHGCFWHAHSGCHFFKFPEKDGAKWKSKLEGNRSRDEKAQAALESLGWRVLIVWECQIRGRSRVEIEELLDRVADTIKFRRLT